jgi:hypothetical protein
MREIQEWFAPHLARQLLAEVLEGCYLPASGSVSYDALETECWRLAAGYVQCQEITNAARACFIRDGLFYLYNALNPDRKPYFFNVYPRQVALRYSRAAPSTDMIAARMAEIRHRSWRRRYHRQFARQRIEDLRVDMAACQRLLMVHRFVGSARDFDEEKRRLNMKLWRSLFALADGLGISLARSDGTLAGLASALEHQRGRLTIDPVFTAADPPAARSRQTP